MVVSSLSPVFPNVWLDFIKDDLPKYFPHLAKDIEITLVQSAEHILNTYDLKISEYIHVF